MSNGESKIAESKAALCCGFAIALRALFLGILCLLIASLTLAMTQNSTYKNIHRHCEQAQRASVAINKQRIPIRLIATRLAPLAMTRDNDVSSMQHV